MIAIEKIQRIERVMRAKEQTTSANSMDASLEQMEMTLDRLGIVLGPYAPEYSFVKALKLQLDELKSAANTLKEESK